MRVEDVAARAGSDLRARFDGMAVPDARHTRRQTAPARAGLVVAVVVVLVAVGLTAMIRSVRSSPTPVGESSTRLWHKLSIEKAFGPHVVVDHIDAVCEGFVAVGYRPADSKKPGRRGAQHRFRLWTSPNGVRWSEHATRGVPPADGPVGGSVVQSLGHYLLVRRSRAGFATWVSDDLRNWVRGQSFSGVNTMDIRPAGRAFAAWTLRRNATGPGAYVGYRSDVGGRHWRPIVGVSNRPGRTLQQSGGEIGYPPSVRLGDRWVSLPFQGTGGQPHLYQSVDEVHWFPLDSNAPTLIDDLVGDQAGSRALAVEFQADRTLGDRLWSTGDGTSWSELASFAKRYPDATVDRLVQSGEWWILGGLRRGKVDTPTLWATHDFVHWVALDVSRSRRTASVPLLAAHGNQVVGLLSEGTELVIWHRPRSAERSRR